MTSSLLTAPTTRRAPEQAPNPVRAPGAQVAASSSVRLPLRLVLLLGAFTAVPSLSLDFYLPALPAIERGMGASQAGVQVTITGCLIGFALGLLVAGPVSDAHGRRRPLLVGVALYTLATLACAFAPTIEVLIGLRVLQGITGAVWMVTGSAVVRDRARGAAAAKLFSVLMLANGAAPILGPVVGGQLLLVTTWRGLFVVLAVIGAITFAASLRWLPETLPVAKRRSAGLRDARQSFAVLLRDRVYVGYTLARAFGAGGLLAYIAASPFVFQDIYGLSAQQFSVVFGVNSAGLILLGQVGGHVVERVGPALLLKTGMAISVGGSVLLVVALLAHAPFVLVLPGVFAVVAGMGLVFPNSTALGLSRHGSNAGAATALMGVVQFGLQAISSPLTGLGSGRSAIPMGVVVLVLNVAGLTALLTLTRQRATARAAVAESTAQAMPTG